MKTQTVQSFKVEDLFLYDAGAVAAMAEAIVEPAPEPVEEAVITEENLEDSADDSTSEITDVDDMDFEGEVDRSNELMIIDSGLNEGDKQESIAQAEKEGMDFILVTDDMDMATLAEQIAQREGLDAIHIISHGDVGQFDLAGQQINSDSLTNYTSLTESIKNSLSESGDLLLYGCNVGASNGQEFIELVADITGADVAGSDDLTGNDELGGDWDLEVEVGEIEADEIIVDGFDDVLAATGWNNYRSSSVNMGTIYSQYLNGDLTLRGGKASLDYNLTYSVHGQVNEGFIYLDTRTTISFSGRSDNASTVYVDGSAVILQARWGSFSTKRVTLDAGHHKLVHVWENDREEGYYHINVTGATVYREAPNSAPTAANIETTIDEDVPLTFTSSSFDGVFSDVETANAEGIRITSGPTEGKLFLSGTEITVFPATLSRANLANLTYENTQDENGDNYATFQFEVYDGTDYSESAYTYTIDVDAVNDAPILRTGSPADTGTATANETTDEDTELTMTASDYVYDADGDLLTIKSSTADDGTISDNGDGTFTFDPTENFFGSTSVEITFQDPDGEEVTVDIPIEVTPVNDAPEVDDNTISAVEDEAYIFNLTDFTKNYSDVEGEFLSSVKIDSLPTGELRFEGDLVSIGDVITIGDLNDSKLTYKALENENGTSYSTFQFSVSDGTDYAVTPSTMTIDVDAVNDAPILRIGSPADTDIPTASETTDEDTELTMTASDYVLDVDGDLLTIKSSNAADGTITDNGDGTFRFDPKGDFNGDTTVEITFQDPDGEEVTVTIPIEVIPVNDAPVAVDDLTDEVYLAGDSVTVDVVNNDTDVDNDPLSITRIISVSSGTATIVGDSSIKVDSLIGSGNDIVVVYEIWDGEKFSTASLTVKIQLDNELLEDEEEVKKKSVDDDGHGAVAPLAVSVSQIRDGEYSNVDENSLSPEDAADDALVTAIENPNFSTDPSVKDVTFAPELKNEIDSVLDFLK
jgi:hypothetical protein